jgi:hypothetical protein
MFLLYCNTGTAQAADSISVKEINYVEDTITLQLNGGDTQVYFSDSKKKTWEEVPGTISGSNTITMDISWVPISTNYVMTFKGNRSSNILSVTIPKQAVNFKVTYNNMKSTAIFTKANARTIEWRKKGSSTWNTVNTAVLSSQLSRLNNNGATVCFRLAPVNGTSNTDVGLRPSKEVSITIPKKATAPSVAINGTKFCISVKKGMAYRTVNDDGSTTDWTNIATTNNLMLSNVAAKAMYKGASTTQSAVTLQFRTNATSSSQVSKIATVTVPVQEGPPSIDTNGISINYESSSTVTLQVKAASTAIPFEYAIVKKDEELNNLTANWIAITSSTAVSLKNDAVPKGCHIYVRKKTVEKTSTVDFSLASVETDITGTTGIVYPDAPKASTLTTLISTAGVCQLADNNSYLTFQLYSATSTTVSSMRFLDAYGISKGSVTCKSTVVKNTNSTGVNDKYIITTKITSTDQINTVTKEKLYAELTLASSDVITSTDTAGVILYLYPRTKVNNPTLEEDKQKEYTNSFQRVFMSNDSEDDTYFKFKLDLGTMYVPNLSSINSFALDKVAIKTLQYDGYTLNLGTDYTVDYSSYENDDAVTIATATVKVNVSKFEQSSPIDITNTAEPLYITLNNGESLKTDVFLTLVNTATLNNTPISWTITEGKLNPTKKSVITNTDGTTTTVEEDRVDYILNLTLFNASYGVAVSDVTWGGISVLGTTTISGGKATINLSNAKLNKLTTDSTDTKNIIITLSNGFVIKTGCKLTVLNAS